MIHLKKSDLKSGLKSFSPWKGRMIVLVNKSLSLLHAARMVIILKPVLTLTIQSFTESVEAVTLFSSSSSLQSFTTMPPHLLIPSDNA